MCDSDEQGGVKQELDEDVTIVSEDEVTPLQVCRAVMDTSASETETPCKKQKLSDDQIKELITEVKLHECIYNRTLRRCDNKDVLAAFDAISLKLGVPGRELGRIWKNIREKYSRVVKEVREGLRTNGKYDVDLKWLEPFIKTRKNVPVKDGNGVTDSTVDAIKIVLMPEPSLGLAQSSLPASISTNRLPHPSGINASAASTSGTPQSLSSAAGLSSSALPPTQKSQKKSCSPKNPVKSRAPSTGFSSSKRWQIVPLPKTSLEDAIRHLKNTNEKNIISSPTHPSAASATSAVALRVQIPQSAVPTSNSSSIGPPMSVVTVPQSTGNTSLQPKKTSLQSNFVPLSVPLNSVGISTPRRSYRPPKKPLQSQMSRKGATSLKRNSTGTLIGISVSNAEKNTKTPPEKSQSETTSHLSKQSHSIHVSPLVTQNVPVVTIDDNSPHHSQEEVAARPSLPVSVPSSISATAVCSASRSVPLQSVPSKRPYYSSGITPSLTIAAANANAKPAVLPSKMSVQSQPSESSSAAVTRAGDWRPIISEIFSLPSNTTLSVVASNEPKSTTSRSTDVHRANAVPMKKSSNAGIVVKCTPATDQLSASNDKQPATGISVAHLQNASDPSASANSLVFKQLPLLVPAVKPPESALQVDTVSNSSTPAPVVEEPDVIDACSSCGKPERVDTRTVGTMTINEETAIKEEIRGRVAIKAVWEEIYKLVGVTLPVYVTEILTASGFTTIEVISTITENEVTQMENFVKTNGIMSKLIPEDELGLYFHFFDESNYTILPGHRMLLFKLVEELKAINSNRNVACN